MPWGSPPPPLGGWFINSGGGSSGAFVADVNGFGGRVAPRSTAPIDRSLIPAPVPPESVYQTERWGAMTYRMGGFAPGSTHIVELHFAEVYFDAIGKRRFNVAINDRYVLTEYDILARAGGRNKAIQETFSVTANALGEVTIRFRVGSADQPKVDAIVIR